MRLVTYVTYHNIAAGVLLFLTENVSASQRDVGFYEQTSSETYYNPLRTLRKSMNDIKCSICTFTTKYISWKEGVWASVVSKLTVKSRDDRMHRNLLSHVQ